MARLPGSFNANEYDDMGFGVIPKGDYLMQITDSEYKENSKKSGHFLSLKREIMEGKYKGRTFYANLNLDNPNPKAVEIANKEFATTCRACGKVTVEDSEELHFIPHIVSIAVKPGKGDEPDQNIITGVKPAAGYASPAAAAATPGASAKPSSSTPAKSRSKPIFEEEDEDEGEGFGGSVIEDDD